MHQAAHSAVSRRLENPSTASRERAPRFAERKRVPKKEKQSAFRFRRNEDTL
jgi:hypothetical protein